MFLRLIYIVVSVVRSRAARCCLNARPRRLTSSAATSVEARQGAASALQALGRLKIGTMNKTEAAYAAVLDARRHAGEVAWFKFEGIKLRLADNTFYIPDFAVMLADGVLEMHEVKGFWQDDARVKIKIASDLFPMRFVAVRVNAKKDRGGWVLEEF